MPAPAQHDGPRPVEGVGVRERPIIFTGQAEIDRFLSFVSPEPNSGCHIWCGAWNEFGYGRCASGELAHRSILRLYGVDVPKDRDVDHKCFTRCCVNPDHLEVVTRAENIRRAAARRKCCPAGHLYDAVGIQSRPGKRICRECDRLRQIAAYSPTTNRRRRRHLRDEEVSEIRRLLVGGMPQSKIAEIFSLSQASISNIATGKNYAR